MLIGLALALTACSDDRAPPAANQAGNANETGIAETDATPAQRAASAALIPANFRGLWAEGRAACAQLSHPSRLIISESVIRYPAFVLVSERVDLATDLSFAVKGQNQRTGAPAEAHFSIDATGSVLTDEAGGGAVRERCQ
jgi:hypothetical protein